MCDGNCAAECFFFASVSVIHLCVREQTKQIKMFRKYLIPSRLGNLLKSIYNHEEEPAPTGSCFRASVAISPLLNPPPCVFFLCFLLRRLLILQL